MIKLSIDGKEIATTEGTSVLEAALQNGVYIPHLCHHPDLPENGSCRLCVVQVHGHAKPEPSCMLKAEEGMIVDTKAPEVLHRRSLAMELLLAAHPEDCSTCSKYGNCEMQTLIQYVGAGNTRLRRRVKGFPKNEENPLLIHDMSRCVLCGRCVRACADLRGVGVLQYQKKDLEVFVETPQEVRLAETDCRFCTACAEVCPTGAIRDKESLLNTTKSREQVLVPCRDHCPAHADIPRYVRFVKQGDFEAAAAVIHEKLPMPKCLGYICVHNCESGCRRSQINEPLSIRNIKRYAVEHSTGLYWKGKGKQLADTGKKVCVVGAGPSGLTAAYYLRKQGHAVTVKEALPAAGGMLAYAIPEYRMPREIVQEEVEQMASTGFRIETGVRVDKPVELLKEYDAVLMAIGTHRGVRLPIPGANLPGVLINIDFLQQSSLHQPTGLGRHVIVLGGGNVAMDCARTAVRMGAEEVHVACLEARDKMTSSEEEIHQAEEEGIHIHPAQTFERITGEDHVTGVDFMNVKSFSFDENHRAVIEKEAGSEHHIAGDTVIFATGQRPEITEEAGLKLGRGNSIVVKDIDTDKSASVPGIFACGDAIYGTKSVVQAVESGREAASQIDKYLGGDGNIDEVLAPHQNAPDYIGKVKGFAQEARRPSQIDPAPARCQNFDLFDHGLRDEDACMEAGRCLQCDLRLRIQHSRLWSQYAFQEAGKENS